MASPPASPGPAGPPTSPEEQIARLLQRGMLISDHAGALHFLSNVSYYRFRGYLEPFVDGEADDDLRPFLPGTTFADVLQRYNFDVQLRTLVLEAFNHIEISIRSQWTNHLAHHEGGGELAHLNSNLFGKHYDENLEKLRDDYNEHGKALHGHDFEACPIWALSETLSFGQLSRWYGDTTLPVKKLVASHYQLDHKQLGALLHNLTSVRNFCAHHERLWDRPFATRLSRPRGTMGQFSDPITFFNSEELGRLYNSLVMIAYLTRVITNSTTWTSSLVALMKQHTHIPRDSMGFIPGWEQLAIWQPFPVAPRAGLVRRLASIACRYLGRRQN